MSQESDRTLQQLDEYMTRSVLGGRLGQAYGGKRDIYKQAGYPEHGELDYNDYKGEFDRHDIARRLVTAFPDATWREGPTIKENEEKGLTDFEQKYKDLVKKLDVYHYFHRADVLSCVGNYSVVLMGLNDISSVEDMKNEASGADDVVFLQVYSQANATIKEYYDDPSSEKFGRPKLYQITMKNLGSTTASRTINVHESRIIHFAEECIEDDYQGTPCLMPIYNRLKDLDKIFASCAEGFWRAAWPGLAAKKDPEVRWQPEAESEIQSQFQRYAQGLSRVMRLEGVDIQELASKPASPKDHVDVNLDVIAGTRRIPKRILTGSEQGEMASTQDRENWHNRIMERRMNWAQPYIIHQFLTKLDRCGVLDMPADGYSISWPRKQHSERDQTEINRKKSEMIAAYAKQPGTEAVYPHFYFLTKILEHSEDEAKEIIKEANGTAPIEGEGEE